MLSFIISLVFLHGNRQVAKTEAFLRSEQGLSMCIRWEKWSYWGCQTARNYWSLEGIHQVSCQQNLRAPSPMAAMKWTMLRAHMSLIMQAASTLTPALLTLDREPKRRGVFVNLTQVRITWKEGCQLRSCSHQTGLWACLWVFPMNNG